jgi:hypothetical protein
MDAVDAEVLATLQDDILRPAVVERAIKYLPWLPVAVHIRASWTARDGGSEGIGRSSTCHSAFHERWFFQSGGTGVQRSCYDGILHAAQIAALDVFVYQQLSETRVSFRFVRRDA